MGIFGLYLKHAFTVEASFYMHTDWLMFARKVLGIEGHNLDRVRRILRAFYKAFDCMLVLNSDQRTWLSGHRMNLDPARVHQTAHWVNMQFKPCLPDKQKIFGIDENCFVMLYVGRVSNEKGVLELTEIYREAKQKHDNLKMVIVGKGPAVEQLQRENRDALFISWVDQSLLPQIYSSADLLVLPSKFDTFCNVVLEALSCGLPVIAYAQKGPKDIIRHGKDGYLVNTLIEMQQKICEFLSMENQEYFRLSAIERATCYEADKIIEGLMEVLIKD
jgi:glycosyltransferase involved in cell wall biosynthesis